MPCAVVLVSMLAIEWQFFYGASDYALCTFALTQKYQKVKPTSNWRKMNVFGENEIVTTAE